MSEVCRRRRKCLNYVEENIEKPEPFWNDVLWTIENQHWPSKNEFGKKSEAFVEKNTLPTVKHVGADIVNLDIEVEERLGIPARQWSKAYLELTYEVPSEKKILEWPPQSPVFNIIEKLWRDLVEVFCQLEWARIPKAGIERL